MVSTAFLIIKLCPARISARPPSPWTDEIAVYPAARRAAYDLHGKAAVTALCSNGALSLGPLLALDRVFSRQRPADARTVARDKSAFIAGGSAEAAMTLFGDFFGTCDPHEASRSEPHAFPILQGHCT